MIKKNSPITLIVIFTCIEISVFFISKYKGSILNTFTTSASDTKKVIYPSSSSPIKSNAFFENEIANENKKQGTANWIISDPSQYRSHQIEGYSSATSVSPKDTVTFFVNTKSKTFKADIYRIGYYNGKGAILLKSVQNILGKSYPLPVMDSSTGVIDEKWSPSFSLQIPDNWISGVYMVKLTTPIGNQNYIPLIIRQPERKSDIVFIRGIATDQAYNSWGGASLYPGGTKILTNTRATKVSYNRPFFQDYGAGQFFWWEYPMVRFLEKNGYDVSYLTDIDVHEHPEWLLNHKVIVIAGHDEYWTKEMRDGVESAVNKGVSLANFAANTSFWQIRLEKSASGSASIDRIQVGYKIDKSDKVQLKDPVSDSDESLTTTQWRSAPLNRPEQTLFGAMYEDVLRFQGPFPWVVKNANTWVFNGTSLQAGDQVPNLVGYEYDKVFNNYPKPSNLTILSDSPVKPGSNPKSMSDSNSVIYQSPSGSWVFDAGTVQWSWGLDSYSPPFSTVQPPYLSKKIDRSTIVDSNIQIITQNILNKFISK